MSSSAPRLLPPSRHPQLRDGPLQETGSARRQYHLSRIQRSALRTIRDEPSKGVGRGSGRCRPRLRRVVRIPRIPHLLMRRGSMRLEVSGAHHLHGMVPQASASGDQRHRRKARTRPSRNAARPRNAVPIHRPTENGFGVTGEASRRKTSQRTFASARSRPPWDGTYVASWRCGAESNRRIELLQSSALPLGYRTEAKSVRNLGQEFQLRKRRNSTAWIPPESGARWQRSRVLSIFVDSHFMMFSFRQRKWLR